MSFRLSRMSCISQDKVYHLLTQCYIDVLAELHRGVLTHLYFLASLVFILYLSNIVAIF